MNYEIIEYVEDDGKPSGRQRYRGKSGVDAQAVWDGIQYGIFMYAEDGVWRTLEQRRVPRPNISDKKELPEEVLALI